MNEIKVFEKEEFGKVRTLFDEKDIWFVAKDVATILGYSDSYAMTKRLDDDEVRTDKTAERNILKNNKGTTFINESGLYHSIIGSKQENAKAFRKWVTSEVLPSIRKTGSYSVSTFTSEDMMKALTQNITMLSNCVMANNAQLQDHSARIEKLEKELEQKKVEVAPDLPPKEHIIALVRNHADKTKETDYAKLYRQLYSDYGLRTHTNPTAKAKNRNMTTIAFIEKEGDIKLLLSIAKKLFAFGD